MKKLVLPCAVTHMSARVNMSLQIARAVDDDGIIFWKGIYIIDLLWADMVSDMNLTWY